MHIPIFRDTKGSAKTNETLLLCERIQHIDTVQLIFDIELGPGPSLEDEAIVKYEKCFVFVDKLAIVLSYYT